MGTGGDVRRVTVAKRFVTDPSLRAVDSLQPRHTVKRGEIDNGGEIDNFREFA
jgi:hypothetical protein